MNKKWLLAIILVLTIGAVGIIIFSQIKNNYNSYVISESKWNKIINDREESTSISINNIRFNNNSLLIDEENSTIYYSIVDANNKYNPKVDYKSEDNIKIAINKEINEDLINQENEIKLIIYNDKEYRTYSLVATNYPLLNVNLNEQMEQNKTRKKVDLYIFDNNNDAYQRGVKSDARLEIKEENSEYSFSLTKQSPGRNKRENNISIFGMPKQDDYTLKKSEEIEEDKKYVLFFINNKSIIKH